MGAARLVVSTHAESRHDEAEQGGAPPSRRSSRSASARSSRTRSIGSDGSSGGAGESREAEPLLRRAIDIATESTRRSVRAEATQTLGGFSVSLDRSGEAQRLMEVAFRLAKEAGDTTNLMRAYNNLAAVRSASRGLAYAIETLSEGLEIALVLARSGTARGSRGASATCWRSSVAWRRLRSRQRPLVGPGNVGR